MPASGPDEPNRARSTKRAPAVFAHQRARAGFLRCLIGDAAGTVGVPELQGARPEGTFLKPFGEAVTSRARRSARSCSAASTAAATVRNRAAGPSGRASSSDAAARAAGDPWSVRRGLRSRRGLCRPSGAWSSATAMPEPPRQALPAAEAATAAVAAERVAQLAEVRGQAHTGDARDALARPRR